MATKHRTVQQLLIGHLSPKRIKLTELAAEKIQSIFTNAPRNDAPIGGLKIVSVVNGSPHVRQEQRISTRLMPRAFADRIIWAASLRRPRLS
jgi:hypothetical protein